MKALNALAKACAILVAWIVEAFSLFLLSLWSTGSICCGVFILTEAVCKRVPVPLWAVWLVLSLVLWVCFEVYVTCKVHKTLRKRK